MFFLIPLVIVSAMLLSGHPPDQAGWMMLVGLGWFAGYLDCRRFARSDQEKDRVLPPDATDPLPDDTETFES